MINQSPTIKLSPMTDLPPVDAESMLLELGAGENGFMGTPVGIGKTTLLEYIEDRSAQSKGENLPEDWVPSSTYWIVADGHAAGLLRLRHYLNDALRHKGGHIGYYVRPSYRGQGIATQGLAQALPLAKALGEPRIMLTTNPQNPASIAVIEANGGQLEATVEDPSNGAEAPETILQFWIT